MGRCTTIAVFLGAAVASSAMAVDLSSYHPVLREQNVDGLNFWFDEQSMTPGVALDLAAFLYDKCGARAVPLLFQRPLARGEYFASAWCPSGKGDIQRDVFLLRMGDGRVDLAGRESGTPTWSFDASFFYDDVCVLVLVATGMEEYTGLDAFEVRGRQLKYHGALDAGRAGEEVSLLESPIDRTRVARIDGKYRVRIDGELWTGSRSGDYARLSTTDESVVFIVGAGQSRLEANTKDVSGAE